MRVSVEYHEEHLDLEVPDERVVADGHGPAGAPAGDVRRMVLDALENPRHYPPLRQAVVPGDHVVIALDGQIPQLGEVVSAICESLARGGVEMDAITALVAAGTSTHPQPSLPAGVQWTVHDPEDRTRLAYLASTREGLRVYLDRLLTDADVVVPVGRIAYDAVLGYRGPWSLLFPDLSDLETARRFRALPAVDWPDHQSPPAAMAESAEVSWLLGSQFHVGIVGGTNGPAETVAGLESAVQTEGMQALDRAWTFEAPARAELVVAGIGQPGLTSTIRDLARGLLSAARLVERGGKIAVLSRVEEPIGPALRRVLELEDPRQAPAALRGHESDPDALPARQIAQALAWADVYLHSALDPEVVESSPLIRLDRAEEVRRLVAASRSSLFLSQSDQARARVLDEPPMP